MLLAPLRIDVDVDTRDTARRMSVRVGWLWWSTRIERSTTAKQATPRTARGKPHRRSPRFGVRSIHALLTSPGFLSRLTRAILQLANRLRPVEAVGVVRIGFDDPSLTGELLGGLCTLRLWPGHCWRDVGLVPDFSEAALEVVGRASWRIQPGQVLWPVVSFLGSPVVWRAVRAAWRVRQPRPHRAVVGGRESALARSQLA